MGNPLLNVKLRGRNCKTNHVKIITGCALYADEWQLNYTHHATGYIIVNICKLYGDAWDIKFNSLKSQLITFGFKNPNQCFIILNGTQIPWATEVRKYISACNSGFSDISNACRKFYKQSNNIMSVLGKCSREMSAIHLIKTHCLPTMLYGCEVRTAVLTVLVFHGITVLEEFLGVVGERASNLYNTFVTHCLCRTLLIYIHTYIHKSFCIAHINSIESLCALFCIFIFKKTGFQCACRSLKFKQLQRYLHGEKAFAGFGIYLIRLTVTCFRC